MKNEKPRWSDPEKNFGIRWLLRLHFLWFAALLPLTIWNAVVHHTLPHFHYELVRIAFFVFFFLSGVILIFFLFYLEAWSYPETLGAAFRYSGGVLVNVVVALVESKGQVFYAANVTLVLLLTAQALSFGFLALVTLLSKPFFLENVEAAAKPAPWREFFLRWRIMPPKLLVFFLVVFGVSGFYAVLFASPVLTMLGSIHWGLALFTVLLFAQQIVAKMRPFFKYIVRGYAENDMTMNLNWTLEIIFGIILSMLCSLPIMGGAVAK